MMGGLRYSWPLCLVILILYVSCCCNVSEARRHRQKPSAVVVGAVYCDTCFQDDHSKGSHYISGASVAVECAEGSNRPAFHQEVKTDNQGNFKVALPFSVSKHVKKIEGCNVKLVKSSEPNCAVASTATSSLIHLKERKGRNHIFSAGYFTFKPLKQPGLSNQQPSVTKSQMNYVGDLLSPQFPNIPTIPQIPTIPTIPTLPKPNTPTLTNPNMPMPNVPSLLPPLPALPPLPKLPSLPLLPPLGSWSESTTVGPYKDNKVDNGFVTQPQQLFPPLVPPILPPPQGPIPLPPNPLQPAPLLPNPLQPPAPPLIPNPFQPPTPPPGLLPPLPNLPVPPIPGLTPVPTPTPPATSLPIPPIIPLPPGLPLIPGFPPVKPMKVNP